MTKNWIKIFTFLPLLVLFCFLAKPVFAAAYQAARLEQSHPAIIELTPSSSVDFWVKFKNIGDKYWSGSGDQAVILRTMLDLYANILVIVNAKNNESEFMAFRYTHCFLKANLNDPVLADEPKKQIMEGLKQLHDDIRSKAHDYIFKGKLLGYWYSPEYSNTKNILDTFDTSLKSDFYNKLSSASHGGLLGLRLFKDSPDEKNPNPRADKKSQNLALSVSNHLILEIFGRYGHFMDPSADDIYINLSEKFKSLKSVVKEQSEA